MVPRLSVVSTTAKITRHIAWQFIISPFMPSGCFRQLVELFILLQITVLYSHHSYPKELERTPCHYWHWQHPGISVLAGYHP